MSFSRVKAIHDLSDIQPNVRLVLYAIAFHADESTGECFPSISRISERSGLSSRTVERVIKTLKESGLINVGKKPVGEQWVNHYFFPKAEVISLKWQGIVPRVNAAYRSTGPQKNGHSLGGTDTVAGRVPTQVRGGTDTVADEHTSEHTNKTHHTAERVFFQEKEDSLRSSTYVKENSDSFLTGESYQNFVQFWSLYPLHINKSAAKRAWAKEECDDFLDDILKTLKKHKREPSWQNHEYIPHPKNYLLNRRWEDEIEPAFDDDMSGVI